MVIPRPPYDAGDLMLNDLAYSPDMMFPADDAMDVEDLQVFCQWEGRADEVRGRSLPTVRPRHRGGEVTVWPLWRIRGRWASGSVPIWG